MSAHASSTALSDLLTPDELTELLRKASEQAAPRRFALWEFGGADPAHPEDGWLYRLGVQYADRAVLTDQAGRLVGQFSSAASAAALLGGESRRLRLVWIDS